MTYQAAIAYMEKAGERGSILGLSAMKTLLEKLGNPQNTLSVIHVAGTNGKGSICTFLETMYRAENKKVGRYISPVLHCYLERFQMDGNYMKEEKFAQYLEKIIPQIESMEETGQAIPTAFEIETAIAFLYFADEKPDIVILETGMGGLEDATNVIEMPVCSVIASIGMDHMQFLGDTIDDITRQKAGIMKKGCLCVCYPNEEYINEVLRNEYQNLNAKSLQNETADRKDLASGIYFADKDKLLIEEESLEGSRFYYKGEEYRISLAGRYQIYNAITAIETKLKIDGYLDKTSLQNARWEGRFQMVSQKPLIIKDGAHNIDGVTALKESIEKHFTNRHLIFIIGVLRDKEYEKMMKLLCPMADVVFTITPPVERGLSAQDLQLVVRKYCDNVFACENVKEAVEHAKDEAVRYETIREKSVIIAWGSLSYIGLLCKDTVLE